MNQQHLQEGKHLVKQAKRALVGMVRLTLAADASGPKDFSRADPLATGQQSHEQLAIAV
jgi:hypothetical protein